MILPCAHCGGAVALIEVPVNEYVEGNDGETSAVVVQKCFITCTNPACGVQIKARRFSEAPLMVAAWNRRYVAPVEREQPPAPVTDPTNLDFPPPEA